MLYLLPCAAAVLSTIPLFLGVAWAWGVVMAAIIIASSVAAGAIIIHDTALLEKSRKERDQLNGLVSKLTAFQATSVSSWAIIDKDGKIEASPMLLSQLGLRKLGALVDFYGSFVKHEATMLEEYVRRALADGNDFSVTVRLANGSTIFQASGRTAGKDKSFLVIWLADITKYENDRQATAAAMADMGKSLGEMKEMLAALPVPLWLRNKELSIVWCNKAYADDLDLSVETALRLQKELIGTAKITEKKALAKKAVETNKFATETTSVVIKGDRKVLEITEAPIASTNQILGFAIDKTQETDIRSRFQRHMAAQDQLLEKLGSPIAIYGADTRIQFYNQAYRQLWGLDEAWLNTKPSYGEILEDLRSRRRLPEVVDFQRYKKERISLFTSLMEPQESLMHLPDGSTLRMLVIPHPLGGLMFVMEDVTSKLELESSYNTLMAVQRETLNNLAEGVAVFGSDGRLKLYNPVYTQTWKLKPEDLQGEPHMVEILEKTKPLLHYGDNWQEFREQFIVDAMSRTSVRKRLLRTDGMATFFSTAPLPDGAVLTSHLDVTDSARVEQALMESNKALEAADRLKSEFIANVSYQMRSPLNAVMGFSEILTNQYFGQLNQQQAEYSKSIYETSQRLLSLVDNILDLASIEAGYSELDIKPVSMSLIIEAVAAVTQEWLERQKLSVDVDCPSSIGTIPGDEKRLKQALFNIITNSIKFTPPGGRIAIKVQREDAQLNLQVTDTGIGIPKEDINRLFGRFERSNIRTGETGAGLGLALVKNIIELHGGKVSIESEEGKGTTVMCTLPASYSIPG